MCFLPSEGLKGGGGGKGRKPARKFPKKLSKFKLNKGKKLSNSTKRKVTRKAQKLTPAELETEEKDTVSFDLTVTPHLTPLSPDSPEPDHVFILVVPGEEEEDIFELSSLISPEGKLEDFTMQFRRKREPRFLLQLEAAPVVALYIQRPKEPQTEDTGEEEYENVGAIYINLCAFLINREKVKAYEKIPGVGDPLIGITLTVTANKPIFTPELLERFIPVEVTVDSINDLPEARGWGGEREDSEEEKKLEKNLENSGDSKNIPKLFLKYSFFGFHDVISAEIPAARNIIPGANKRIGYRRTFFLSSSRIHLPELYVRVEEFPLIIEIHRKRNGDLQNQPATLPPPPLDDEVENEGKDTVSPDDDQDISILSKPLSLESDNWTGPNLSVSDKIYGVAKFSMRDIFQGCGIVELTSDVQPTYPRVNKVSSNFMETKNTLQFTQTPKLEKKVNPFLYTDNQGIINQSQMSISVRIPHLIHRTVKRFQSPFARVVFVLKYNDIPTLRIIREIMNASAQENLNLPDTEAASLMSYILNTNEKRDPSLDYITGVQIVDKMHRYILLEGSADRKGKPILPLVEGDDGYTNVGRSQNVIKRGKSPRKLKARHVRTPKESQKLANITESSLNTSTTEADRKHHTTDALYAKPVQIAVSDSDLDTPQTTIQRLAAAAPPRNNGRSLTGMGGSVAVLHNPNIRFPHRLYGCFNLQLKTIKLNQTVDTLMTKVSNFSTKDCSELYMRCLFRLKTLKVALSKGLITAKSEGAFPTVKELIALDRKFGEEVLDDDIGLASSDMKIRSPHDIILRKLQTRDRYTKMAGKQNMTRLRQLLFDQESGSNRDSPGLYSAVTPDLQKSRPWRNTPERLRDALVDVTEMSVALLRLFSRLYPPVIMQSSEALAAFRLLGERQSGTISREGFIESLQMLDGNTLTRKECMKVYDACSADSHIDFYAFRQTIIKANSHIKKLDSLESQGKRNIDGGYFTNEEESNEAVKFVTKKPSKPKAFAVHPSSPQDFAKISKPLHPSRVSELNNTTWHQLNRRARQAQISHRECPTCKNICQSSLQKCPRCRSGFDLSAKVGNEVFGYQERKHLYEPSVHESGHHDVMRKIKLKEKEAWRNRLLGPELFKTHIAADAKNKSSMLSKNESMLKDPLANCSLGLSSDFCRSMYMDEPRDNQHNIRGFAKVRSAKNVETHNKYDRALRKSFLKGDSIHRRKIGPRKQPAAGDD
ncbi:hypothetical protein AAMO2058_001274500 [Amorphochlora amoebiformis]